MNVSEELFESKKFDLLERAHEIRVLCMQCPSSSVEFNNCMCDDCFEQAELNHILEELDELYGNT